MTIMLRLKCACGAVLKAPSSLSGKRAQCKKCGAKFVVPQQAASRGSTQTPGASKSATAAGPSDDDIFDWLSKSKTGGGSDFPAPAPAGISMGTAAAAASATGIVDKPIARETLRTTGGRSFSGGRHDGIRGDTSTSILVALLTTIAATLVVAACYFLQTEMKGPAFLLFYVLAFACIWTASEVVGHVTGVRGIVLIACAAVMGIAYIRIYYGATHGMHKFAYLVILMFIFGSVLMGRGLWTLGIKNPRGEGRESPMRIIGSSIHERPATTALLLIPFVIGALPLLVLSVWFVYASGRGGYGGDHSHGGCGGGGCGGGGCGGGGCGGGGCGGCGGE